MKSSPGLLESASASLKHFLYLDDYRVASYVSQLKNGLTLIKQLRELSSRGIQDNPLSFEKEQRVERKLSGGLGFGVGNVEGERVQTETHRVASGVIERIISSSPLQELLPWRQHNVGLVLA